MKAMELELKPEFKGVWWFFLFRAYYNAFRV